MDGSVRWVSCIPISHRYTAWRRNLGIILKKSYDYEAMTRFFIGLFERNSNLTSGENFPGVEWYTRLNPNGAFK